MKACPACGAWWLPGAEQCPEHRAVLTVTSRSDHCSIRIFRVADAPRVLPRVLSDDRSYFGRLASAALGLRPITGPLIRSR